mgnify:FL=1
MLYKLNDYWCIQFNIIKFKNLNDSFLLIKIIDSYIQYNLLNDKYQLSLYIKNNYDDEFKNIDSLDYNTVYDLLYSYFSNMTTEIKKNEYQFNYNWSLEFSIKKIYK